MGQGTSRRLIFAGMAATTVVAFALGAATAVWLISPYLQPTAATAHSPDGSPIAPGLSPAQAAAGSAASSGEGDPAPPAGTAPAPTGRESTGNESTGNGSTAKESAGAAGGDPGPKGPPGAAAAAPPSEAASDQPLAAAAGVPPPRALSDQRDQPYHVHLGVFRDAATAERVRAILLQRGIAIGIVESRLGDSTWHLARSGDFFDRTDALRMAVRVHQELGIDPLVVRAPADVNGAG
jgi:hypothetical protein